MKALFSIRPKYKIALSLLTLIVILLCGVLVERSFFSRVKEASNSIYNDRLMPSTAVYHIADHITQRRFTIEAYVLQYPKAMEETRLELALHRQQTDSIVAAFEETYLVQKESESLEIMKKYLEDYKNIEQQLLVTGNPLDLKANLRAYNNIREELKQLSQIQTNVGQDLLDETESIASNAVMLSQLQIVALILTCLIAHAFILASRAISSPLKQRHNLN